ncbi:MAG: glucosyl transferase, partial [Ignavibacteriaceae bacterium]|nr:glucosyl transferase [Ignavibacteriaceae bacterium]
GVWDEIDLYPVGTNSVRGNSSNDIFIVGDSGAIFHFNGVSWKMLNTPNNKGYSKVAIRGNIVVICGNYQGQGLIEIGTRN